MQLKGQVYITLEPQRLTNIHLLCSYFESTYFEHVNRAHIEAAHSLASWATSDDFARVHEAARDSTVSPYLVFDQDRCFLQKPVEGSRNSSAQYTAVLNAFQKFGSVIQKGSVSLNLCADFV